MNSRLRRHLLFSRLWFHLPSERPAEDEDASDSIWMAFHILLAQDGLLDELYSAQMNLLQDAPAGLEDVRNRLLQDMQWCTVLSDPSESAPSLLPLRQGYCSGTRTSWRSCRVADGWRLQSKASKALAPFLSLLLPLLRLSCD